jgi:hypothetical protein
MDAKVKKLSQVIEKEAKALGLKFVNGPGNEPVSFNVPFNPGLYPTNGVMRGVFAFAVAEVIA